MPYALDFRPEAQAALSALEPVLQEAILDQIELAAADPARLRRGELPRGRQIEFDFRSGGRRVTIFIIADVLQRRKTLVIRRIGSSDHGSELP